MSALPDKPNKKLHTGTCRMQTAKLAQTQNHREPTCLFVNCIVIYKPEELHLLQTEFKKVERNGIDFILWCILHCNRAIRCILSLIFHFNNYTMLLCGYCISRLLSQCCLAALIIVSHFTVGYIQTVNKLITNFETQDDNESRVTALRQWS